MIDAKDAARLLWMRLNQMLHTYTTVGVVEKPDGTHLIAYVSREPMDYEWQIPAEFEGYQVQVEVVGPISPCWVKDACNE